MRNIYQCVCLAASFWLVQAHATTPATAPSALTVPTAAPAMVAAQATRPVAIDLAKLGSDIGDPHLMVSENVPPNRSIDSVLSDATLFRQSFDPRIAYALSTGNNLWLHFRVLADANPSPTGWMLELSKPYIDRVEFYQKDALGTWQMQAAGDRVAHAEWPQKSLNPRFALPVMSTGVHDFYLKIQGELPLHFSVQLQRTDAAHARAQHRFLLVGLLLGMSALMLAFSAILATAAGYREFLWYGLFVCSSCLATVTYLGLSNYGLWPHHPMWANQASYWVIMVATAAQLQFCRTIFLTNGERSWWRTSTSVALVATILAIGLFFYFDHIVPKTGTYFFAVYVCTGMVMALVIRALYQGNRTAWLWLIAYIPLIISIGLASLNSVGVAINGLPYDAPVYALLFEVAVLLVALHLHAKSKQAQQVRREVMDSIDPHTGFVAEHLYEETLAQLWSEAHKRQSDLTVVYVDAKSGTTQPAESIVRLLRTVVRDIDTVAHVDKNLYAILMIGQRVGTSLTNRLSRLVALGLMAGHNLEQSGTIQFRIVATSKAVFAGTWQQVDALLREKILNPTGWSNKSIRYVRLRSPNAANPDPDPDSDSDSEKLSQLWDVALTESARLDAAKA